MRSLDLWAKKRTLTKARDNISFIWTGLLSKLINVQLPQNLEKSTTAKNTWRNASIFYLKLGSTFYLQGLTSAPKEPQAISIANKHCFALESTTWQLTKLFKLSKVLWSLIICWEEGWLKVTGIEWAASWKGKHFSYINSIITYLTDNFWSVVQDRGSYLLLQVL